MWAVEFHDRFVRDASTLGHGIGSHGLWVLVSEFISTNGVSIGSGGEG